MKRERDSEIERKRFGRPRAVPRELDAVDAHGGVLEGRDACVLHSREPHHLRLRGGLSGLFSLYGFWIRIPNSGFWLHGFGFQVSGLGFRVQGFGFRVSSFGFRVQRFGFKVHGFGIQFSGFREAGHSRRKKKAFPASSINPQPLTPRTWRVPDPPYLKAALFISREQEARVQSHLLCLVPPPLRLCLRVAVLQFRVEC